jgi:hypothetical protein
VQQERSCNLNPLKEKAMTRRLSIAIACLSLLALGTLAVPEAKAYRAGSYHRSYTGSYRYSGYRYSGYWYPSYYYPPSYGYPPVSYAAPYYPSYGWSRYYYPSYRSHYVPYHGHGRR